LLGEALIIKIVFGSENRCYSDADFGRALIACS
jgi:hypothetical protein